MSEARLPPFPPFSPPFFLFSCLPQAPDCHHDPPRTEYETWSVEKERLPFPLSPPILRSLSFCRGDQDCTSTGISAKEEFKPIRKKSLKIVGLFFFFPPPFFSHLFFSPFTWLPSLSLFLQVIRCCRFLRAFIDEV